MVQNGPVDKRERYCFYGIINRGDNRIVIDCIEKGLVTGESIVTDGTFIPGNVSQNSKIKIKEMVV